MIDLEQVNHPVVRWAQAMGSDATTVRDAAHEASHALEFGLKKWDPLSIDRTAFSCTWRLFCVASEIDARAVERIVCEELGLEYAPLKWAETCLMEQAGLGLYRAFPPTAAELVAVIEQRMERPKVLERATLILMASEANP